MIYAIAIDDQSICKIGYAQNVKKRMSGLQTVTPFQLRLVKTRDGCRRLERIIHKKIAHLRVRGEWFKLTPETMVAFDDAILGPEDHAKKVSMGQLLTDICTFCEAQGLPVTRFGELAMNDPAFVLKLQRGRRLWPETEARARNFMLTYRRENAA